MPSEAEALTAFIHWVQTICVGRDIKDVNALCDGSALFEVLQGVDDVHFLPPRSSSLETLHRRVVSFCIQELHIPEEVLPVIDTKEASKERSPSKSELLKLLRLVLVIVLKSDHNDEQVNAMQTLSLDEQLIMKQVVEDVLSDYTSSDTTPPTTKEPIDGSANREEVNTLRRDVELGKQRLSDCQDQLAHTESHVDRVTSENKELLSQLSVLRQIQHERDALRDQLDEAKPMLEAYKKQERSLSKVRERAEEATELKRSVKELEKQIAELMEQSSEAADRSASQLAEQHRSVTLKSDRKYTKLVEEHTQLAHEHEELEMQLEKLMEERRQDQTQMHSLLERVRTLEVDTPHDDLASSLDLETQQQECESMSPLEDDPMSSTDVTVMMDAVKADVTALRNNLTSKHAEAENLLRKLEKKAPKEAGKTSTKDIKNIGDLLTDSFRHEDLIMQRLQRCWDHVNKVCLIVAYKQHMQQRVPSSPVLTDVEVCVRKKETHAQRERDALRQEQRLMASAYHQLSQRLYREVSWQHVIPPVPFDSDDRVREVPRVSGSGLSWIAQQRNALSGALGFTSK